MTLASNHPNWAGGMREAFRRHPVRRARLFFDFLSSTSCLHLQAFLPSFFGFNICLRSFEWFLPVLEAFSPLHNPPHGLRIPPAKSAPSLFFSFFCAFGASYFLLFFSACFFINVECFWARLGSPKSSQNHQNAVSEEDFWMICISALFFPDFHKMSWFFGFVGYYFFICFSASPRTCSLQFRQVVQKADMHIVS